MSKRASHAAVAIRCGVCLAVLSLFPSCGNPPPASSAQAPAPAHAPAKKPVPTGRVSTVDELAVQVVAALRARDVALYGASLVTIDEAKRHCPALAGELDKK